MAHAVVLYDANVLHPAPIRDLFVRLAVAAVVRARWTGRIHEEWIRSVLRDRPDLTRDRLERTRALMDRAVQDCLVSGYEHLVDDLALRDEGDRHVLAAAIAGGVERIITFNTRDFPASALAPHGIEAQDPDSFVIELLEAEGETVLDVLRAQRAALVGPAITPEGLLIRLANSGLVRAAGMLTLYLDRI